MSRKSKRQAADAAAVAAADEKAAAEAAKERKRGKQAWKLMGNGSAILAGIATARALDATWKTATGHKPPLKPENPEVSQREAMLWTALSAAAIAAARTYATRRAADYWVRSTGDLPPGLIDKSVRRQAKKAEKAARKEAMKVVERRA